MRIGKIAQSHRVWFERAYEEKSNILQFLKVHLFSIPFATMSDLRGCCKQCFR
jgi:hypothetical protein